MLRIIKNNKFTLGNKLPILLQINKTQFSVNKFNFYKNLKNKQNNLQENKEYDDNYYLYFLL